MKFSSLQYKEIKKQQSFLKKLLEYNLNYLIKKNLAQPNHFITIQDEYHNYIKEYINKEFNYDSEINYKLTKNKVKDYNYILENIIENIKFQINNNNFSSKITESRKISKHFSNFYNIPKKTMESFIEHITNTIQFTNYNQIIKIQESKYSKSSVGYIKGEKYFEKGFFKTSNKKNKILKNILISL